MADIINKLNQLLEQALNYVQEGLKESGLDVDFQSPTKNPYQPQMNQSQCPQQHYEIPINETEKAVEQSSAKIIVDKTKYDKT